MCSSVGSKATRIVQDVKNSMTAVWCFNSVESSKESMTQADTFLETIHLCIAQIQALNCSSDALDVKVG